MTLGDLLRGIRVRRAGGVREAEVLGLAYDSRKVAPGFLFFAFPGSHVDGRRYAEDARAKGALAVVSELPAPEGFGGARGEGRWIEVEHGRKALAAMARAFYREPDRRVHFTGITGTNGKTTTAFLAEAVLSQMGKTGMIGTIEYRLAGEVLPAPNTTPESLDVMQFADELARRGGKHLISEVSSHALALGRVDGFHFHTTAFTNLTRDHLDFHPTMDDYRDAKALLFRPPEGSNAGSGPEFAVLNVDDPAHVAMMPRAGTRVIRYGLATEADLRADNIEAGFDGLNFDVSWDQNREKTHTRVSSKLVGLVNVSNILAAAGIGLSYGMDLETIAAGIAQCEAVPGRFERVDRGQPFLVVVDYAHTDDALRNAIRMARKLATGRVITVFGCGGDRDRAKRPLMGMAAAELSDLVVLTSDNPRSEEPLAIMNDALVGLNRFDTPHTAEVERAKAIRLAIGEAAAGDVVLIAGKGHETYQVLKSGTIHFDDREVAVEALAELGHTGKG